MSEQLVTPEDISGVIAKVELKRVGKTGWPTYSVLLKNGEVYDVTDKPDTGYTPKPGDNITIHFGQFNQWYFVSGDVKPAARGNGKPPVSESKTTPDPPKNAYKTEASERESYWRDKFYYEKDIRDGKIEFQSYFGQVMNLYAAGIPTLEEPPTSLADMDKLIDNAFDKAKAIYLKVNPKKKGGEEKE